MNNETEIVAIVNRIESILQNPRNEPIDMLGSYIVGATIVRDDIEEYYTKYPLLEKIAELGADLETLDSSESAEDVLLEIRTDFHKLKEEVKAKISYFSSLTHACKVRRVKAKNEDEISEGLFICLLSLG